MCFVCKKQAQAYSTPSEASPSHFPAPSTRRATSVPPDGRWVSLQDVTCDYNAGVAPVVVPRFDKDVFGVTMVSPAQQCSEHRVGVQIRQYSAILQVCGLVDPVLPSRTPESNARGSFVAFLILSTACLFQASTSSTLTRWEFGAESGERVNA